MLKKVCLLGAGGLASEIYQQIKLSQFEWEMVSVGEADASFTGTTLRTVDEVPENYRSGVLAVADPHLKQDLLRLHGGRFDWASVFLSAESELDHESLGKGAIVFPNSSFGPAVKLGAFSLINRSVTMGHGSSVGEFSNVGVGAILSGDVQVGRACQIGPGTIVARGVRIGNNVKTAPGTVVLSDVEDGKVLFGNPSRTLS